jgi:NAD-dependent dihydropyrimidine dehydrogenase PreA subunit
VRRLRRYLPDGLHHLHRGRPDDAQGEGDLRGRLSAPAGNLTQDLYVSGKLGTGRVMAKDEDVCLHCGLCAERCPTGAWDMQKFYLEMTYAGADA